MKVSNGLEFPVVALPGVGHMPAKGEHEQDAARVFYVAATRANQRLVIGVGGDPWEFRLLLLCKLVFPGRFGVRYLAAVG
ncbi:3'-5' exonuclease [Rhodoferax sp.]|uniref:3'-5' exonuclease n=1 Tax=Rhodoferax sp. TaxID=50421 RepID=UPI00352119EC